MPPSCPTRCYVQASVADEAQCKRLVDATLERYGRLDILVNNAGTTAVIPHADLDAVTDEIFRRILDTNLLGTWYLTRAALPHLKQQPRRRGRERHLDRRHPPDRQLDPVRGVEGGDQSPDAAARQGVGTGAHQRRRARAGADAVDEGLGRRCTPRWRSRHRCGRSATADDIAATILGVVLSPYMTGEIVLVDGGLSLVS